MTVLPAAGLRVLDCATFIAAPFTAALLGEFGAEVIKIEQPGVGDSFRHYGTPSGREGDTLAWLTEARNKRSVTLDLRKPEGAALFRRLVGISDVLCENFRPGTLERWGLGWEELRAINPRLVLLRVSGYGQTGPYRDRPGFARIAHAVGGLTHLAGMPGGPPVTPGSTSLADYMSGLFGAVGVLLALRHRDRTGEGQVVDVALYESVFRVLDELAPAFAAAGKVREREGAGTANACPHGHFECGDGGWVAIACTNDRMWQRLAEVMDRPDLARPDTYATARQRIAGRAVVDGLVQDWCRARSRAQVLEECQAGEVPSGAVNSIADIFGDPQFRARDMLLEVVEDLVGTVTVSGVVPKLSATPGQVERLGPALGEANREVFGGLLGLDDTDLDRLRADGVV